ncbi:MAG: hypothetical protein ACI9J2_001980 [Saprospiraceae bacterium]|jgi:hypothetical protein
MEKLTLDTGLLIKAIEFKEGYESVLKICKWHADGKVLACVSNRLFNPDSVKMQDSQREKIRRLLEEYNIEIMGNLFRLGVSPLSGKDMMSGSSTDRTEQEINEFKSIVGIDPTQLSSRSVGSKLSNKIGDYDSLYEHFCKKRDVFLTFDGKDYFHKNHRSNYQSKLDLMILHPEEYVERNPQHSR